MDPAWVDGVSSSILSAPDRAGTLQAAFQAEADPDRKLALTALAELVQAWPDTAPAEASFPTYARAVVDATGTVRTYLIAAARAGGALDPEGRPSLPREQALELYAQRRLSIGVVGLESCGPR